jgi:hypothetical protein
MNKSTSIDRLKVTPLLLRVFWKLNGMTRSDYDQQTEDQKPLYPSQEAQIYTWPDCTLGELADILKGVIPQARGTAHIMFSLVAMSKSGNHIIRPIGRVYGSRRGVDDDRTLASCQFITGNLLDVQVSNSEYN